MPEGFADVEAAVLDVWPVKVERASGLLVVERAEAGAEAGTLLSGFGAGAGAAA